jgi:hypothetical protein
MKYKMPHLEYLSTDVIFPFQKSQLARGTSKIYHVLKTDLLDYGRQNLIG